MNLEQTDRALHEFTDPLHADSQSGGDLAVPEAFRAKQDALALLRRELRKGSFELPHSLVQNDLLLWARSRIHAFPNHRAQFFIFALVTTPLRAVHIHGKIVSHTKDPRAKVVALFALKAMAHKAKEGILDNVFGLIRAHTQAAEIRSQRWSQVVIQIDNALASPCVTARFRNEDSKFVTDHRVRFSAGRRSGNAKRREGSSSHYPFTS